MANKKTETAKESILYRQPMRIKEILVYGGKMYDFDVKYAFPVCPKCGISMEHDYQNYCSYCGQRLSWVRYKEAKVRYAGGVKK